MIGRARTRAKAAMRWKHGTETERDRSSYVTEKKNLSDLDTHARRLKSLKRAQRVLTSARRPVTFHLSRMANVEQSGRGANAHTDTPHTTTSRSHVPHSSLSRQATCANRHRAEPQAAPLSRYGIMDYAPPRRKHLDSWTDMELRIPCLCMDRIDMYVAERARSRAHAIGRPQ